MNVVLRIAAIVCIPLVCLTGPPRPAGAGEPASPAKTSPFRFTLEQAAPHAIATDDTHIYCATHGWAGEQWKSKQQIQRFRITDGNHERFTEIKENAGHIQLYEWPEKQVPEGTTEADAALMRLPVRAIAVCGEAILATDALGGKVHAFHKTTGKPLGAFTLRLPHALAVDRDGRLWVGHEHRRVSIFTAEGRRLATPPGSLCAKRRIALTLGLRQVHLAGRLNPWSPNMPTRLPEPSRRRAGWSFQYGQPFLVPTTA